MIISEKLCDSRDPFNKPKAGVLHGKKQVFNDRGDTGNREDKTNDLISKMN